jgi:hypothetical protein
MRGTVFFSVWVYAGGTVSGKATISGVGQVSAKGFGFRPIGENEPVDRQLALLREFVEKTETRFYELDERISELPGQWQEDIREAREAIESMMSKRLEEAESRHIRIRLVGIAFLMAGVPILAIANVI